METSRPAPEWVHESPRPRRVPYGRGGVAVTTGEALTPTFPLVRPGPQSSGGSSGRDRAVPSSLPTYPGTVRCLRVSRCQRGTNLLPSSAPVTKRWRVTGSEPSCCPSTILRLGTRDGVTMMDAEVNLVTCRPATRCFLADFAAPRTGSSGTTKALRHRPP